MVTNKDFRVKHGLVVEQDTHINGNLQVDGNINGLNVNSLAVTTQEAFNQANTSVSLAQTAFDTANTGVNNAASASYYANTGIVLAQSAYDYANTISVSGFPVVDLGLVTESLTSLVDLGTI